MSKFDVKDDLDAALFRTYNIFADLKFFLSFSKRALVAKNKVYKDKHSSERCFILGTGPSLATLTVSQTLALKNEIVFGTNSLYKAKIANSIYPTYYSLLDNLYWAECSQTFSDVAEHYSACPPIFITDHRAIYLANRANNKSQHIAIHSSKYPVSTMSDKVDGNIFGAMNVVSYSILTAMYMGFNRIYLLGCDYNAFCSFGRGHAYDDALELKSVNYNLAFYLRFYWITTEFHYLISKLAKSKGIVVENLTAGSLLDAYNRKDLTSVIGS